jgi:hypothetical protein
MAKVTGFLEHGREGTLYRRIEERVAESYGEQKIGQGRDATKLWLQENPDMKESILHQVKVAIGMIPGTDEKVTEIDVERAVTNGHPEPAEL